MIASLRHSAATAGLAAVLLAVPPPAPAFAQEESRLLFERANEHLARGLRARGRARERELGMALDAYLNVLRLGTRTRNVIFNLALTLAELGRAEEAFNYYSEYLRVFDLGDDERAEGVRRIDALRPAVAVIAVESTPEGAEVRVGRRDLPVRGTTPLELAVGAGSHALFLTREGFEEATATVTASVGATARAAVELSARPVQVQVIAPSFGRLTLDDAEIVPGRTLLVTPGPHVVRLAVEGAPPVERRFEVRAGDPPLVLELAAPAPAPSAPAHVALSIDTRAEVFVDGIRVGHGESLDVPMLPGLRTLRVTAPGRRPLMHRFTVQPQQRLSLRVDLGAVPDTTALNASRFIGGLLTVGGLATSLVVGIVAVDLSNDWKAAVGRHNRMQPGAMPPDALRRMAGDVTFAANMADLAVGITAAVGIATIVLLLVGPGEGEESTVHLGAAISPGAAMAALAWRAP